LGYGLVTGTERILYYLNGLAVTGLWHENQGRPAPDFAVNDTIALLSVDPSITNAWDLVTQSVSAAGSAEDLIDVKDLLAQSIADEGARASAAETALDTKIDDTEADLTAAVTQVGTGLTASITQVGTDLTALIT
jgi:hypothetical protein